MCKVLLWGLRLACLPLSPFFGSLKGGYTPCPHCHHLCVPHLPCQAQQMPGLLWATWGQSELEAESARSKVHFPPPLLCLKAFSSVITTAWYAALAVGMSRSGLCYLCCQSWAGTGRKGKDEPCFSGVSSCPSHILHSLSSFGSSCNGLRRLSSGR